ncbi:MAG: NAD(P)/FAD-dependent oxidoreductase [Chloroflexales bacterium]|nr:NAD(P)/FAD-dependent oxidoreductase [Chloroflexales bacterium]
MPHIVILGGGFAGLTVTRRLERRLRHNAAVQLTLISRQNYMAFTPLLAEVAGNSIEPRHAVPPLRGFLHRARFHEGTVQQIDLAARQVVVAHSDGGQAHIPYDELVIALGAVTNYHRTPGAADYSFDLKSLDDAIRLRNHVLATLELADVTPDPAERAALLTVLAAGGGYAGVEGLGLLLDFVRRALPFYPSIQPHEPRFILASHSPRLLEQVDERLGRYVVRALQARGVEVRLGVSVAEVSADAATLNPGGTVPTRTVLWAAGIAVTPLLRESGLPTTEHGAVQVAPTLQVVGHPELFALGDCAAVPKAGGATYAPTAQNATAEARLVADNLAALLAGRPLRPFRYRPLGSLAAIGSYEAVAQLGWLPLAGLPAWLAWRAVYLLKLPGLSRKLRVALDWLLEALLPTDIVQLPVQPSDDRPSEGAQLRSREHQA